MDLDWSCFDENHKGDVFVMKQTRNSFNLLNGEFSKQKREITVDPGPDSCWITCIACFYSNKMRKPAANFKRKSEHNLTAFIGKSNATIDLIDTSTQKVLTTLKNSHSGRITSICIIESKKICFTADSLGHVIKWNLTDYSFSRELNNLEKYVSYLQTDNQNQYLFICSRSIRIFDLNSNSFLKTILNGHSDFITQFCSSPFLPENSDLSAQNKTQYFCSLSPSDKSINLWILEDSSHHEFRQKSLNVTESCHRVCLTFANDRASSSRLVIAAMSFSGKVFIFENSSDGNEQTLDPVKTINFVASVSDNSDLIPISLFGIKFKINEDDLSTLVLPRLLLVYGSSNQNALFEEFDLNSVEPGHSTILRDLSISDSVMNGKKIQKNFSNGLIRKRSANSTCLDLMINDASTKKSRTVNSIPIIPHVSVIGSDKNSTLSQIGNTSLKSSDTKLLTVSSESQSSLNAKSFCQILTQAINSNDNTLLEDILRVGNRNDIQLTIKSINSMMASKLLKILIEKLETTPARASELANWFKSLFTYHTVHFTNFLSTFSTASRDEYTNFITYHHNPIIALQHLILNRNKMLTDLHKVQGKLSMLLDHIAASNASQESFDTNSNKLNNALVLLDDIIEQEVYNETFDQTDADHSDEEEDLDDILMMHSSSEYDEDENF